MRARVSSAVLAVAIAASAVTTKPSQAQSTATATTPRRLISVAIAGPREEARVLDETIRELLARLQLTTIHERGASAALLAVVEIDLAAPDGAHVVVRSATGASVLDRTVPRDSNAAIQREQIAHAVRGAAEAELLVEEDRVASPTPPVPDEPTAKPAEEPARAETVPVSPEPAIPSRRPVDRDISPTRSASKLALDVATFAGAGFVAQEIGIVPRVGGSLAVASRHGVRPSLALGALYAFPFTAGSNVLSSRSSIASVRLIPAVELFRGSRWSLDVGAGAGVDILSVEPSSTILSASTLGPRTTRVDPIGEASVTARVALASDVVLTLAVVSDLDLTSRRYVFDDRGQRSDVLTPWSVRPMLLAGLSFTALGEGAFRTSRAE